MEAFSNDGYFNMELLRFTTCGSVDDGKSTLIGRLLYDSKSIFEDQMEALEESSRLRGDGEVDLAHLTDGLRAEREQGITIDVAYRYFATPKRKFIIADTPGHVQYTRNMVTGASTADLAIILIDARLGVQIQSKRHAFIASLLGIPHLLVAINKMDLMDYSEKVYNDVIESFTQFSERLDIHDITFIPISALNGDNVVDRSESMPWYSGSTVLHHLETVHIASDRNLVDVRFPVQYVIRPDLNFRGYAGRVESGVIRAGDAITVLPSMKETKIKSIETFEGSIAEAFASQSVTICLEDEIDISRGDMLVRSGNMPKVTKRFEAMISWMHETSMKTGGKYILRHTTRDVQVFVQDLHYRVNMENLHREEVAEFALNDIGKVTLKTAASIFIDPYKENRGTGSFILIDPASKITVAAGIIRKAVDHQVLKSYHAQVSPNVVRHPDAVGRTERELLLGQKGVCLWFTGLSGSGKSTIANALCSSLHRDGRYVVVLDGDNIRHGLCGDLAFDDASREENIRRISEVAKLFIENGAIVLTAFISPFIADRDKARSLMGEDFIEVFVDCPIETCRQRDPKGLYAKADSGQIKDFTGIDSPYEVPPNPEIQIKTDEATIEASIQALKDHIFDRLS